MLKGQSNEIFDPPDNIQLSVNLFSVKGISGLKCNRLTDNIQLSVNLFRVERISWLCYLASKTKEKTCYNKKVH